MITWGELCSRFASWRSEDHNPPNQKKNLDYLPAGNPSELRRAEAVRPPTVLHHPASGSLVA
ncbi:hypothetical protein CRENBAI_004813 [Crenichthys baileyi]|uniref:Uncharacterized protein n=1 Tax=Crenichthys baileyi TaxID=28760 RepID=A0AAV9QR11_9TELE